MTGNGHIKVFISYCHVPATYKERCLALATRLQTNGILCLFDQFIPHESPKQGWHRWMEEKIDEADFILVVSSEEYLQRYRGHGPKDKGLGGKWEGAILSEELYEAGGYTDRMIPVLFDRDDAKHIPKVLRAQTHYIVSDDAGYDRLYRRLTDQPEIIVPAVGEIRRMPSRKLDGASMQIAAPAKAGSSPNGSAITHNLPTANEAEPLYRRAIEIFLKFTRVTGHKHPHLRDAFRNYVGLLSAMGRSDQEIHDQLNALTEPYGIQLPSI